MVDPSGNGHDEAEGLLPWYATGQLEGDERALVERHLASCVACQRQLRFDHHMIDELPGLDPEIDSGWARLRARIESDARPARRTGLSGAWRLLKQPAIATLAVAQLAFVVLAGGMLLSISHPQYEALSSSNPPPSGNVIVVFRADATEKDILDALRASGASLVGGPTSADAYLLYVPAQKRASALATLQADEDVQMAQPIDQASQ